jgi:hypothetical protein
MQSFSEITERATNAARAQKILNSFSTAPLDLHQLITPPAQ